MGQNYEKKKRKKKKRHFSTFLRLYILAWTTKCCNHQSRRFRILDRPGCQCKMVVLTQTWIRVNPKMVTMVLEVKAFQPKWPFGLTECESLFMICAPLGILTRLVDFPNVTKSVNHRNSLTPSDGHISHEWHCMGRNALHITSDRFAFWHSPGYMIGMWHSAQTDDVMVTDRFIQHL